MEFLTVTPLEPLMLRPPQLFHCTTTLSKSTFELLLTFAPSLLMQDAACWNTIPENLTLLRPEMFSVVLRTAASTLAVDMFVPDFGQTRMAFAPSSTKNVPA